MDPTPAPSATAVDGLVEHLVGPAHRRYVGLAVGVLTPAGTCVRGYGGTGPRGAGGPPAADSVFQVGSVTKTFTALLLADAVSRGELTLGTPLAAYLPGVPPTRGRPVTLEHLATHTAGLPRLPKGLLRQALRHRDDPYRAFTTADLEAALARTRLRREPGTKVAYSNFGAALLGEVLVRRTGLPYDELVASRIAGPLGLTDTVVRPRDDQQERVVTAHSGRRRPVPDWDLGAMPGAGALRSTVRDLLVYLQAHLAPPPGPLGEATRTVLQPRAGLGRYVSVGLGWHLTPVRGTPHTAAWHNGGVGGAFSFVALVPGAGCAVAVLTNTARSVDRLGLRLVEALAGPEAGGG